MTDKEKYESDCVVNELKEGSFNWGYSYKHFFSDLFGITYAEYKSNRSEIRDSDKVIYIGPELLVGAGDNRFCYAFPGNPNLCIKIDKGQDRGLHNSRKKRLKRTLMPWLADFSSNREEARFYLNKAPKFEANLLLHLPHCYGTIHTNLGQGMVFERIKNYDGGYSQQIDIFLKDNKRDVDRLILLIDDLIAHLKEAGYSIFAWNPENLLVKLDHVKGDRIVVIDWKSLNRPNNDCPFSSFVPYLRTQKMIEEANGLKQKILDSMNY